MGERLQTDDWRQHVHQAVLREAPLREAAPQRLVRVEAASPVLNRLGGATHDDAQVVRLSLERVVVHGEHLLVVVLPAHRVGNLVEVHHLVEKDDESLVARAHEEGRENLEVVIPVVVADHYVHTQLAPCLGLVAILAAEPLGDVGLGLVIPLEVCAPIHGEKPCEVIAMDQLLNRGHGAHDSPLHGISECGVLGRETVLERHLRLHVRDPTVEDQVEGTALGPGLGAEVANELPVGGKALAARALEPALRREVRVCHHKAPAHGVVADGLEKEALAAAVATHKEAEARTAVSDEVEVVEEGRHLAVATNGDVGQAHARDDASLQGVDDHLRDAPRDAGRLLCSCLLHGCRYPLRSCS